ncbi:sulfurtransferase TusA family protein [Paracoccus sulfuroxidans]|uniref:tRNA 2-thiouridine synthesizing protein A n=1 Tax=Paracoccus sulfuroxidans TaxID=384678 RepID=A0A562N793_9RHOB|nr:sulfurtransferase TusA family protein [Paracoccus sulfuroxidans]TWI28049.1 tRNA 2-thiouridine synthesizing protein A [Paracoccus sulfuroxidans]
MTTRIDARGLLCPLPVLRLRKILLDLPPGARVVLVATDPAAIIDVPHFCRESGHLLIETRPLDDGSAEYLVERGAEDA